MICNWGQCFIPKSRREFFAHCAVRVVEHSVQFIKNTLLVAHIALLGSFWSMKAFNFHGLQSIDRLLVCYNENLMLVLAIGFFFKSVPLMTVKCTTV